MIYLHRAAIGACQLYILPERPHDTIKYLSGGCDAWGPWLGFRRLHKASPGDVYSLTTM